MKTLLRLIKAIFFMLTFILGMSCVLPDLTVFSNTESTGSLILNVTPVTVLEVSDPLNYPIHHYRVTGIGPSDAEIEIVTDQTPIKLDNLLTGSWRITVVAEDSVNYPFLTSELSAEIESGNSQERNVLFSLAGTNGILDIDIEWEIGLILDPRIHATLTNESNTIFDITFDIDMASESASSSDSPIPAGKYTLTLYIYDGTTLIETNTEDIYIFGHQPAIGTLYLTQNPRSLTEINVAGQTCTLAWTPPETTPHLEVYSLYYREKGLMMWRPLAEIVAFTDPKYTITNSVLDFGIYEFGVLAVYENGSKSGIHTSIDPEADPSTGWYVVWEG